MSDAAEKSMDAEAFLVWAEGREGKWELHDGRPVAMAPEMASHARIKAYAVATLLSALRRAGAACGVYADGLAVRVSPRQSFVPDVLVTCPPTPDRDVETSAPLIVVEVLSPSTAAYDHGAKLEGYFGLPSLAHYLILDPERRALILHSRGGQALATRILREGEARLDPPGLSIDVAELFGDPDVRT